MVIVPNFCCNRYFPKYEKILENLNVFTKFDTIQGINFSFVDFLNNLLLYHHIQSIYKKRVLLSIGKSLLLMNDHVSYFLQLKISQKNVCPSVSLCVSRYNNFWRSLNIEAKIGGYLLHIKFGSGIKTQNEILILIRILIVKKNVAERSWWVS